MTTDKNKVQYLPFHAINEFMRNDYRLTILQEVFENFEKLKPNQRQRLTKMFSNGVQVPGFRNSSLAPLSIRVKNSTSLFEKSPEFSALIVESWSSLHQDLKLGVWNLLESKGWKPLPIELDRIELPGFTFVWPKEDTFEVLSKKLRESLPNLNETEDNISLMVVWIGNRLPYGLYSESDSKE
jgi:hypothetical protein